MQRSRSVPSKARLKEKAGLAGVLISVEELINTPTDNEGARDAVTRRRNSGELVKEVLTDYKQLSRKGNTTPNTKRAARELKDQYISCERLQRLTPPSSPIPLEENASQAGNLTLQNPSTMNRGTPSNRLLHASSISNQPGQTTNAPSRTSR